MAMIGDRYIGIYCPRCGKGLMEVFDGTKRLTECIRGHRWHLTDDGMTITFRTIEKPKEKPTTPTMFCEHGEYGV